MGEPKVRMDRSKAFATVHGERDADSKYANVHFIQDGLPFDASGFLILDHEDFEPNSENPSEKALKLRALAERKLKKASKGRPVVDPEDADAPSDDADQGQDEGDDAEDDGVNLEAWLRGEQDVQWHILTQEIARRYKRRVSNQADAVLFLVEQGVVPPGEIAKKYQKHLD